jgi:L-glyceraldehyde 3-phosphate reductase
MTSVLIGASRVSQIEDAVGALKNPTLGEEELRAIEAVLAGG